VIRCEKFAVYCLCDPRDGSIKYVGGSGEPWTRFRHHIGEAKTIQKWKWKPSPVYRWVCELLKKKLVPVLYVMFWTTRLDAEATTIIKLRSQGHKLLNVYPGGRRLIDAGLAPRYGVPYAQKAQEVSA